MNHVKKPSLLQVLALTLSMTCTEGPSFLPSVLLLGFFLHSAGRESRGGSLNRPTPWETQFTDETLSPQPPGSTRAFHPNVFLLSFTHLVVALCRRRPPTGQRAAPAGRVLTGASAVASRVRRGGGLHFYFAASRFFPACKWMCPQDKYKSLNFQLTSSFFAFTWKKKQNTHFSVSFDSNQEDQGLSTNINTCRKMFSFTPYTCTQSYVGKTCL